MRKIAAISLVTVILLWSGPRLARTQEKSEATDQAKAEKSTSEETKSKVDQRQKPIQPFRLDFSLNELEGGKKINSRHYSMNLTGGGADEVKIGTKVPVPNYEAPTNMGQYQYLDLGISIWALLREVGDELLLEVRSEGSWAKAPPEQMDLDPKHEHSPVSPPIVSQMKINGSTLLVTGKPIIIGTVDDGYSNRQYQLEVTATKLR